VRFGLNMPNFAEFADPATIVGLARDAEAAGWDGFFVWDHINLFGEEPVPLADPWILLAAVAQVTHKIAIGTMVTPVPRRRPWVLARQTATLDRLSGGRLILGVGLGLPADTEFEAFGEDPDIRVRAQKLDEGLAILAGLWSGETFEFRGRHFQVRRTRFLPTPIQQPRIPVWVAGTWNKEGPLRRAAAWDGYFPLKMGPDGDDGEPITPDEIATVRTRLEPMRDGRSIDLVVVEEIVDANPTDLDRLRAFDAAGATWYMLGLSTRRLDLAALVDRVRQGPPQL
jgi:alkanesulfonate monooxygenase SsuD/methylene tetrahydromethanopterin reductase-like flavin-dependent oxidoreductase (luciferase family)